MSFTVGLLCIAEVGTAPTTVALLCGIVSASVLGLVQISKMLIVKKPQRPKSHDKPLAVCELRFGHLEVLPDKVDEMHVMLTRIDATFIILMEERQRRLDKQRRDPNG